MLRLIRHASGHFVIIRLLDRFSTADSKFVVDTIVKNCLTVCNDHFGLRCVKHLLAQHRRRQNDVHLLCLYIAREASKLVEGQYGNYVIQAVLDVAPPETCNQIKLNLEGRFTHFSKQKFSSNVVEKILKDSSGHWLTCWGCCLCCVLCWYCSYGSVSAPLLQWSLCFCMLAVYDRRAQVINELLNDATVATLLRVLPRLGSISPKGLSLT